MSILFRTAGVTRVYKDILAKWETKYNISITYDKNSDRIYVKTDIGFWRIYLRNDDNQYLLFHRNKYDSSIPYEVAICQGRAGTIWKWEKGM